MKYEKPNMEFIKLETMDVICTSGLTGGTDFNEELGGDSTSTGGQWP